MPLREEEEEEVMNRDQRLDVPFASTGVKSVLLNGEKVPQETERERCVSAWERWQET